MPRSECFCELASCEPARQNERFMMVKENGAITNRVNFEGIEYLSGHTINDIDNCEMKLRLPYKDKSGEHQPKNNYCDKGGHKERSLANDHRKNGHKKHWSKTSH